jgi:hypothetical protein
MHARPPARSIAPHPAPAGLVAAASAFAPAGPAPGLRRATAARATSSGRPALSKLNMKVGSKRAPCTARSCAPEMPPSHAQLLAEPSARASNQAFPHHPARPLAFLHAAAGPARARLRGDWLPGLDRRGTPPWTRIS